jgi:hypothetical protein
MSYLTINNYKKLEEYIENCTIYENESEYFISRNLFVFEKRMWEKTKIDISIERELNEYGEYIIISKLGDGDEAISEISESDIRDINKTVILLNNIVELQLSNQYGINVIWR